jgi:secreted Zn-dependent insulinase-like peptidase
MTLFQLTINGFNDKQHILLEKVLDTLLNIKIDTRKFEIFKERVSYSSLF